MTADRRRIVVTGATRGLGRSLVDELIARGHRVAGCGRTEERIAELRERYSDPHQFAVVDVANEDEVEAWSTTLLAEFGLPDLLINNAALINVPAPLWEIPGTSFSDIIDVNIKGTTNVIRHFLPPMVERGQGVVVNFSSGWGRSTSPGMAPYCATKYAVEGLSQALAQDLPPGMAAVALNPGVIHTEMLATSFGAEGASSYPEPEEWAQRAVPFLLGLGPRDNGASANVPG